MGERIKELREINGTGLSELAEAMGVHKSYVWQVENGRIVLPRPDQLKMFAFALKTSTADLLCAAGALETPDFITLDDLKLAHMMRRIPDHMRKGLEAMIESAAEHAAA